MTILFSIILLAMSAVFSGLTLGLMSLEIGELKRKAELDNEQAKKLLPIRKKGNELLATLILANVFVNIILVTFLNQLVPAIFTIVFAPLVVAFFGTLLPQAIFSRYALRLGGYFIPLVKWMMKVMQPITEPLGNLLDSVFGKEEVQHKISKGELEKIIDEYQQDEDNNLSVSQAQIVKHAIEYSEETVRDVMTPRTVVTSINTSERLTKKKIEELKESGHSRFPVYEEEPENITGILYLHDLLNADTRNKTAGQFAREDHVETIDETTGLDVALNTFLRRKRLLFIVMNEFKEMVGIVTLEDVLEDVIGRTITDEFDEEKDLRAEARKKGEEREKERKENANENTDK